MAIDQVKRIRRASQALQIMKPTTTDSYQFVQPRVINNQFFQPVVDYNVLDINELLSTAD